MLIPLRLYITFVQVSHRQIDMKTVTISELRANLLKYLTHVQRGERIEVTSKGAVMATLVPPVGAGEAARARLDELSSTASIGDVVTPIDEDWEAGR
jgi:prevent-host-death family protein